MLGDARSESLVTNFAAQWLYLRNIETFRPDMRLYPDFDDNLRIALRKETEMLFHHVLREDRRDRSTTMPRQYLKARHCGSIVCGLLSESCVAVEFSEILVGR